MKTNKLKKTISKVYIMLVLTSQVLPVYAADDPLTVVNNLSNLIFGFIRAIGMIMLGLSIVQFGISFKSHDPSQRSQALLGILGGLLITFSKEILNGIMN